MRNAMMSGKWLLLFPAPLGDRLVEELGGLERVPGSLVDVLEAVRAEVDPAKPARNDDEDIVELEDLEEVLEARSGLGFAVVVVV